MGQPDSWYSRIITRLRLRSGGKINPDMVTEDPPGSPAEGTMISLIRSETGLLALRALYAHLLADDPKAETLPPPFLEYLIDLLISAKDRRYSVDFYKVFRECKEADDGLPPSAKLLFLSRLADWLQGKRFSRIRSDGFFEQDWHVEYCGADALIPAAPLIPSVRRVRGGMEREMVPLFDVFSGLKIDEKV